MTAAPQRSFPLPDEAATARLGGRIASILRPGDIVLLIGDLGAGKTALARAVIRALAGDPRMDVPSPSFALVQPYEAGTQRILHADLYRLIAPEEIEELGLQDERDAIVLVEWPDRAPELAASAALTVSLAIPEGGAGRLATLDGPRAAAIAWP